MISPCIYSELLGGLGKSIADHIPSAMGKEQVGSVADSALDNPDLFNGLFNLVGKSSGSIILIIGH